MQQIAYASSFGIRIGWRGAVPEQWLSAGRSRAPPLGPQPCPAPDGSISHPTIVRAENLDPDVLVMQPANQGVRHDPSGLLNRVANPHGS